MASQGIPISCLGNWIGITLEIEDPLDKPFGFLVLKPSGVRFAEISFRNYFVNWVVHGWNWIRNFRIRFIQVIAGVVASRFGIFTVGLQMAIKVNQVK